mgnify:CR=1 FL=1
MCLQNKYPPLSLPIAPLKLARRKEIITVRCLSRGKFVALTPEEWVRQHFIHYLVSVLGYPIGRIVAECVVSVGGQRQRADIVYYGQDMKPLLIVECKAPSVSISQVTMNQAARYMSVLLPKCVVLTNGLSHFVSVADPGNSFRTVASVPTCEELTTL